MTSERILVVDDEEAIREIVTSMLQNAGYTASQAASGKQALEILGTGEEFQLMLSDLMMAEMDGHSKRVTAFTIAMARAMGMSGDKIRVIARGAFLHDIGKMAIPDAILRKPGALIEQEVMIMREHCARGYHMLKKIPFLTEA